ncbi:ASCH/PUA domain-containing protein [Paenibacillus larvae]|uniref:ASCH/PUA domain-containing protein n=1 Tax=Paenibacillus larvae TaxID=1464 RepID=UPI002280E975|nr:ASCH/PUA domain-containing protein [Paenibacillus larvae]MCY9500050.1 DUF3850 domain-containing protein [Paenibacillus larvae]
MKPKLHKLKLSSEYFRDVRSGLKTFEVRKNDRSYKLGDLLLLREYNPTTEEFTGEAVLKRVSYMLSDPVYVKEGYVILGLDSNRR